MISSALGGRPRESALNAASFARAPSRSASPDPSSRLSHTTTSNAPRSRSRVADDARVVAVHHQSRERVLAGVGAGEKCI